MDHEAHYEAHTTESYESAYFYEPGPYQDWLVDRVNDKLPCTRLLDVGGGTGNFTDRLGCQHAVVLDPYLQGKPSERLKFVSEPAEAFMEDDKAPWKQSDFDGALLKEVVHHFQAKDRSDIFRGIYRSLTARGRILIVTRPQNEIDYPFWEAARQVWERNQPSTESFIEDLKEAGFVDITSSISSYPCSVASRKWRQMVQERFWSTFAAFSDEELERETRMHDKDGTLTFEDRLVLIVGHKQDDSHGN